MVVDHKKYGHQGRDQQNDNPSAILEFGCRKDKHHDEGAYGPKPIASRSLPASALVAPIGRALLEDFLARLKMTGFPPAARHASLRQGKRHKNPNGIQRDEAGDAGLKEDDQQGSQNGQRNNALGINQAAAAEGQLAGEKAVCSACSAPRRGKSAKAVLAAMIKMTVVPMIIAR